MKIYIMRHGATEWSENGRHTGLTDIPLIKTGEENARAVGKHLSGIKFDRVFASPLQRAQETCRLAGLGENMEVLDSLLEWNYGDYEGLTTEQIHKSIPEWSIFTHGAPNGESLEDVTKRADRVLEICLQSGLETIALFSSGHFSRALGARWTEQPVEFGKHLILSTGSVSILGFEHQNRCLASWNERAQ